MANVRPLVSINGVDTQHSNADTLIAGQGLMLVELSAALSTPPSGYGVIYARTDGNVYFINDAGTIYQLN